MTADIHLLDAQRERRRYIELANASEIWKEVKASFAIEGIVPDENDAEIAGRMIAGDMTLKAALQLIRKRLEVERPV